MSTATYSQDERHILIETPLGKDKLLLNSFTGHEEISRLFAFELQLISPDEGIQAKDIVGKTVGFSVLMADGKPRYWSGVVKRFTNCGHGDRLTVYRAEVVPWLWMLTRTSDCRIFQEKAVPDIIKQVFGDLGFSDFQMDLKGTHPKWEYCVQYRETDFNFVSRLMEQEGIFYYFKHEKGKHTMILGDHKGAFKDCQEAQIQFQANRSQAELTDQLSRWEHQYQYRSGKWAQTDYNFKKPTTSLMANTNSVVKWDGNSKYEFYDFPGEYEEKSDGDSEVKVRMEEEESDADVVSGDSVCRSFSPGFKFKITKHHIKSEEGKGYVITSVHHSGDSGGGYTPGSTRRGHYHNSFTCIPDTVSFRPARITPKPMIHGTQTAVVVGASGEEIYPDKYARVKVQFHWDREGKKDEKSSCWIRVSQPWAGKQWGAIHIPRVGQEVVVSYLEGDPDQPLITGMVYNEDNMPPYDLPANKTQTGIKTRSSKSGGTDNFNELRFEDKKGSEDIVFHAEKDFHREVEHDDDLKVGNNQTIEIKKDRTETVKEGNEKVTVKQGNRDILLEMGNDSLKLKMGNQTTKLDLGAAATEAMQSITLKVGQSKVTVDQMGVKIEGMMIQINGQVMTDIKGLMTSVQGSAMLTAKGAITMIG